MNARQRFHLPAVRAMTEIATQDGTSSFGGYQVEGPQAASEEGSMRSRVIAKLQSEHAGLLRLLWLIERRWAALEAGETPDFALLLDAVRYTRRYLFVIHWPKEDALLERALEHRSVARPILEPFLRQDHASFDESCARFIAILSRVHNGEVVGREELRGEGAAWIEQLRRIMRREERGTYPWVACELDEGDWCALDAKIAPHEQSAWRQRLVDDYQHLEESLAARARPVQ